MKIQGNDIRVANIDFQTMLSHKQHKETRIKNFSICHFAEEEEKRASSRHSLVFRLFSNFLSCIHSTRCFATVLSVMALL